jgi:ankyrin repeat protein
VTQFLLESDADPLMVSFSGDTALHACATEGSIDCLQLVLEAAKKRKADIIDLQNNIGFNALMWAAAKGHVEVANMLLMSGANYKATTLEGDTALHIAANNNKMAIVELLISKGMDIDAPNRTGDTPLHGSAMEGHVKVNATLVRHGARVDVKNQAGQTPCDLAKFWGNDTKGLYKPKPKGSVKVKNMAST